MKQTREDIAITFNRLHFNQPLSLLVVVMVLLLLNEMNEQHSEHKQEEYARAKNDENIWCGKKSRWTIRLQCEPQSDCAVALVRG